MPVSCPSKKGEFADNAKSGAIHLLNVLVTLINLSLSSKPI